jgi:hypothetical protein
MKNPITRFIAIFFLATILYVAVDDFLYINKLFTDQECIGFACEVPGKACCYYFVDNLPEDLIFLHPETTREQTIVRSVNLSHYKQSVKAGYSGAVWQPPEWPRG